jgi:SAM-dependent methyltransferase
VTGGPELTGYYAARAAEYERIYAKPERQDDLARLREIVAGYFRGRRVLEIACGTGYWTSVVAPVAAAVVATDLVPEVLEIARAKPQPPGRVELRVADGYALDQVPGVFDAALAAFWWSHIRHADQDRFLRGLNARLGPAARVMLLDNRYVEGSSTPIARTDGAGNTYQIRRLTDGSEHEVLKNFPAPAELERALAAAGGCRVETLELPYFWVATYEVAAGS